MKYSVLQQLKTYLEDRGITPVFLLSMPMKDADRCVMLKPYGDGQGESWRTDGRLQVFCRAPLGRPEDAAQLADAVDAILYPPDQNAKAVRLDLSQISVVVEHLSGPLSLGPDAQGRPEFSLNYRVQLGRS